MGHGQGHLKEAYHYFSGKNMPQKSFFNAATHGTRFANMKSGCTFTTPFFKA